MANKKKKQEEKEEEKSPLWEAIKVIAGNSAKCLHPRELKAMYRSGFEKRMYLASVLANPIAFYYLTHNKYFVCDFGIEYYVAVTFLGYFVEKGIIKTFMQNNNVAIAKKKTWRDIPKSQPLERLKMILSDMGAGAWYQKTIDSDVEIRHFFKCSMNPVKLEKACNDLEHKLELRKNSLTVSNSKGLTIFAIAKESKKVYKLDDIVAKNPERPAGTLPFVLGVNYSTGDIVIEDLLNGCKHLLIVGKTRSGKSTTLEAVIESLMYWNANISWYMLDFNESAFVKYENFANVKFIESDFESVIEAMRNFNQIYHERKKMFREAGVINISEYNEKNTNNPMPYIVFVVDEANSFLEEFNSKEFERIDPYMKMYTKKGLKYGMITIQAVQRSQDTDYPIAWKSQMSVMVHNLKLLIDAQCATQDLEIARKALKLDIGEFYLILNSGEEAIKMKACFRKTKTADELYKILKAGYSKNEFEEKNHGNNTKNQGKNKENKIEIRLEK